MKRQTLVFCLPFLKEAPKPYLKDKLSDFRMSFVKNCILALLIASPKAENLTATELFWVFGSGSSVNHYLTTSWFGRNRLWRCHQLHKNLPPVNATQLQQNCHTLRSHNTSGTLVNTTQLVAVVPLSNCFIWHTLLSVHFARLAQNLSFPGEKERWLFKR